MKKYTIAFICILLVTSILVGCAGGAIRQYILEPLGIEREEHPIALPFVVLADEVLQFQIKRGLEKRNEPTEPTELVTEPASETVQTPPVTEMVTEPPTEAPTEPVYTPVDESWFDDALFIGDSRTFGLRGYGRLGKADYFCAGSMTVFSALTAALRDWNFPECTLEYLLSSKTYGKVYIHLGLNELICGTDYVMEGYMELIKLVQKYQPDAVIILQSCMTISKWMGSTDEFSIDELNKLNAALKELAESDPELYRFCDTNVWAGDEEGYLRKEIASDDSHLLGMSYGEWAQYIMEDAGWYGIP